MTVLQHFLQYVKNDVSRTLANENDPVLRNTYNDLLIKLTDAKSFQDAAAALELLDQPGLDEWLDLCFETREIKD